MPSDSSESKVPENAGADSGGQAGPIAAEVHVYSKEGLLARYSIEHGEYLLGRDSSCHLLVDADAVSRHHARLTFSAFELLIEDLHSSNGVFIDGVQVQMPTRIRADQEVQLGSARIYVRLSEAAAAHFSAALADKDLGLDSVRSMLEGQKYKVVTTIGRGGMGEVMQARDLRIRRTVAMKVMKAGHQFSRENVLRFVEEAQVTGQLEHPNIVPVYELGTESSGEFFYTMKHVRGITLDEIIRGLRAGEVKMLEKYGLGSLLTIFQKICDAVAFAHARGVVHRDLKPENVMVGSFGEVLVMDWGLAKNLSDTRKEEAPKGGVEPARAPASEAGQRGFQTMHGMIVGTPPYISPEQARGDLAAVDTRSDIYVLGEILYQLLTLRPPVGGRNVTEIVHVILGAEIPAPTTFNSMAKTARLRRKEGREGKDDFELLHLPGKRVPEGLSAVVMKAMRLAPEERYQSVEEMQGDIAAFQGGFATKAERAGLGKHLLLWAGRHRSEVALLGVGFLLFNALVAGFIYQMTVEKNRAQASEAQARRNEERARRSESLAAERLTQLRGTAPTFFSEAESLLEERSFEEALGKIDYAIEQVPNEASYHLLRGKILQSLLRWDEALLAFQEALRRNPGLADAKINVEVTRGLLAAAEKSGTASPLVLASFHRALLDQKRTGEALAILPQIPKDRDSLRRTLRAAFEKSGLNGRMEFTEDDRAKVNLTRVPLPDLRKIGEFPLAELNLDDTRLSDLGPVRNFKLESLSINRTEVGDLRALVGMPLKSLSAAGTRVVNLGPLSRCPLEKLNLSGTKVSDLSPLAGRKLSELILADCKGVRDLEALKGMPLQRLDIHGTSVGDLSALVGAPLRELNLEGCSGITDLSPLRSMTKLEALVLPAQCKDVGFLRELPALTHLSYKKLTDPAEDFWKQFDSKAPEPARKP